MNQQFHSWVYIFKKPNNLKRYMHPNAYNSIIYYYICQDGNSSVHWSNLSVHQQMNS